MVDGGIVFGLPKAATGGRIGRLDVAAERVLEI